MVTLLSSYFLVRFCFTFLVLRIPTKWCLEPLHLLVHFISLYIQLAKLMLSLSEVLRFLQINDNHEHPWPEQHAYLGVYSWMRTFHGVPTSFHHCITWSHNTSGPHIPCWLEFKQARTFWRANTMRTKNIYPTMAYPWICPQTAVR